MFTTLYKTFLVVGVLFLLGNSALAAPMTDENFVRVAHVAQALEEEPAPDAMRDGQKKADVMRDEAKSRLEAVREEVKDRRENVQENKADRMEKIDTRKTEMQEERTVRAGELLERRKNIISAYFERVIHRLEAALNRMTMLVERLTSRLAKLDETKEIDTTEAKEKLTIAKVKIQEGENALREAKALFPTLLEAENPREIFSSVKDLIQEAIQAVRDAHRALVEAIRSIKASLGSSDVS